MAANGGCKPPFRRLAPTARRLSFRRNGRSRQGSSFALVNAPCPCPHQLEIMHLATYFQMLASYNRLASQRLFAACGKLDDTEIAGPPLGRAGSVGSKPFPARMARVSHGLSIPEAKSVHRKRLQVAVSDHGSVTAADSEDRQSCVFITCEGLVRFRGLRRLTANARSRLRSIRSRRTLNP